MSLLIFIILLFGAGELKPAPCESSVSYLPLSYIPLILTK